ncbi:alpha/beta hydrolase [Deltaproteobacteria bacterium]|nr:alpha/beta hydrolase [Deltaproteobacteria bacterium]
MKKIFAIGVGIFFMMTVSGTSLAQPVNEGTPLGRPPINLLPDSVTNKINNKWLNIPYADRSEAEKLDIYLPNEGKGLFPLIVFVHGGGWSSGDKASLLLGAVLKALDHGYAVVSVNYRLTIEASFPAQINDVKAAIRWIRANADTYGFNPDSIAAWGDSAGGHLVALLGTSGGIKDFEDPDLGNIEESSRIQAVVDWFGPIDLLAMDEQHRESGLGNANHGKETSPESRLFGKQIANIPELVDSANPETYITIDDPAFIIQHGTKDKSVPVQQSINFAGKLEKIIGEDRVILMLIDEADHLDEKFSTQENINEILSFLDRYLK